MNSQYMKVNPNELVIDLPVDEAHVAELMESISRVGLREKPTIWLNDMRIINGFHRVVACQKLGMIDIDCFVDDGDEEAFWDARIIAAKPHAKISNERLAVWIIDSWKVSRWYKPVDIEQIKKEYEQYGRELPSTLQFPDKIAAAQALWTMDQDEGVKFWFADKAKRWGVNPRAILSALGFPGLTDKNNNYLLEPVVDRIGASVVEALAIKPHLSNFRYQGTEKDIDFATKWAEERRAKTTDLSLNDYKIKEKLDRQHLEEEERRKEKQRQIQWMETEAGKAELRKKSLAALDREIDDIFESIESLDISNFPEALRRLTSLIMLIEDKMGDAFPEHIRKTKANPIIAENIELQRQILENQQEIESLKRALNSKQTATAKLIDTAAFSSSEIDKMA